VWERVDRTAAGGIGPGGMGRLGRWAQGESRIWLSFMESPTVTGRTSTRAKAFLDRPLTGGTRLKLGGGCPS
jgi:hypothetical protein